MNKIEILKKLEEQMLSDKTLPKYEGATRLVFGDGNVNAQVMCIGEGPGYWEDQKGRPFVGNAGALLNRLLAIAGLKREEGLVESGSETIFITNVVNYRPPGNRDPEPQEIAAFAKYTDQMIEAIKPEVMVTLGRFSMAKFLPNVRISSVHGKPFSLEWKGISLLVVPMYHPAAALRNGSIMEEIRRDFSRLPEQIKNLKKTDKIEKQEVNQEERQVEQMILV